MKEDNKDSLDEDIYPEPSPEDFLFDEEESVQEVNSKKRKVKFIRFIGLTVAALLILQGAYSLISLFSQDSIELVRTSEQLSDEEHIAPLKDAVVTIQGQGSKGTGFVIHSDGFILTNHHVIHQKAPLAVIFPSGDIYHAEVIESNEELDIALIKVEENDLPYLPIRFHSAQEQETVFVIGNPLSKTQIVNKGEVLNDESPFQIMKISAPIYPGHSGSPVLSEEGEVVGVVYARSIPSIRSGEQGYGLAVPIERIVTEFPILTQFKK